MDFLNQLFSDIELEYWDQFMNDWSFTISIAFLLIELTRYTIRKKISWNMLADAITNFITLYAFLFIGYLFYIAFSIYAFYWIYEHLSFSYIPSNTWTIIACIILADLAYYWEHRLMHRIGIGWATHTVHHSSPYFNISVAYRFGPLDAIFPFIFSASLVILGFNPVLVILSEGIVQIYQALLHTEIIKKLPKPIEAIMNTPSHHRVHHGSNEQYLDKNYAGIFIIWDKIFGSFAEEREPVIYGITAPINTVNPFKVFFYGIYELAAKIYRAKGIINKVKYFFKAPDWKAES